MDKPANSSESDDLTERMEKAFQGAKTLGEFFRRRNERELKDLFAKLPDGDAVGRQILRYWEPWPDWALRAAAEAWSVFFPTIKKQIIYDSFRVVHAIVFEMRLDGAAPE